MNWQTETEPALLTIAEVRDATGLSARTLRYYEELGLLPGVRRRAGGRRVYGADEIERLRFIQRLKTLGLSLAEVKELNAVYAIGRSTGAMLARLDALLGSHLADLDARIAELRDLRDEIQSYRERVRGRSRKGIAAVPARSELEARELEARGLEARELEAPELEASGR